jgi:O-antigen/teichoic acid export membrane protein
MSQDQKSYRQIFKATSLFGGVQVFNILISIIKSKFVAVLLGPEGMGITGLLTTTTNLISGLSNFGLVSSSVKNISEANATSDENRVATIISVLRRLVWITGTFGTLITLALAPWLSQLTFGNRDYTLAFVWLSVILLFNQLTNGQLALLQGLRKLDYLAKANLTGSSIGLIVVIPLYYFWRIDAIVPAIIISSLLSLVLALFFSRKVSISSIPITREITVSEGKKMLVMGFIISLAGLLTIGASYLIRIYVSNTGGIEQVGLYTAGFALVETYVGMIFTAMSADYYPRLSAVNENKEEISKLVTHQAVTAMLILAPVVVIFIIFVPQIINILYSTKFALINFMVRAAILGMVFRAASFPMGYILYAKGDSRLFIKTSVGFNLLFLMNNILGYKYFGLSGLGVSFALNFLIHFFALLIITRIKYEFKFKPEFLNVFITSVFICLVSFSITFLSFGYVFYILGSILIVLSLTYSFYELNKRLNLAETFNSFKKKLNL